jgi:hypothetical protein
MTAAGAMSLVMQIQKIEKTCSENSSRGDGSLVSAGVRIAVAIIHTRRNALVHASAASE